MYSFRDKVGTCTVLFNLTEACSDGVVPPASDLDVQFSVTHVRVGTRATPRQLLFRPLADSCVPERCSWEVLGDGHTLQYERAGVRARPRTPC